MQPAGSAVTLMVSNGPGSVAVPNLANYDPQSAYTKLTSLGLVPGEMEPVDSANVDQGKIVSTEPKAGEKITVGSTVKLKVSSGRVAMPDVIGLSQSAAVEALAKVGLPAEAVNVRSSRKSGTVIAQSYPEDMPVPVGTTVRISIAVPIPKPSPTRTPTPTPTPTTPRPTTTQPENTETSPPESPPTSPTDTEAPPNG